MMLSLSCWFINLIEVGSRLRKWAMFNDFITDFRQVRFLYIFLSLKLVHMKMKMTCYSKLHTNISYRPIFGQSTDILVWRWIVSMHIHDFFEWMLINIIQISCYFFSCAFMNYEWTNLYTTNKCLWSWQM